MVRTPLEEAHVRAMRRVGETIEYAAGDWIAKMGEPADTFLYLEDGEVEAIDPGTGKRYGNAVLGPTQFFGEISFLTGGALMMGARCVQPSRILSIPRDRMLTLMSQIPEMSDIIVTVLAARRRRLLESNEAALTIIGADRQTSIDF